MYRAVKNIVGVLLGVAALAFSSGVARADLIGYWTFDNTVADSSGYGNNGAVVGSVPYAEGKFGGANGAASFSADANNCVSVANSASLSSNWPGYAISLWANCSAQPGTLMAKFSDTTTAGFALYWNAYYNIWHTFNGSGGGIGSETGLAGSIWENVVLRWDGATLRSYRNGIQQGSYAMTSFSNSAAAMRFGLDNRFYVGAYNGRLDDAAIFNATLTVGQCKAIYNVGNSALAYSMADMNKLFALYAAGSGTTNTSDGKTWEYVASGLLGKSGELLQLGNGCSITFSDTGSAGVRTGSTTGWTGLVGYWNFDANVNDSSGLGNNGVVVGSVPYAEGKFGGTNGAAAFAADANNCVSVANSVSLSSNWPGYAISLWANCSAQPGTLIAKFNDEATAGFALYWNANYNTWHTFNGSGGQAGAETGLTGSIWENVVLQWDGAALRSYRNGIQQGNYAMTSFSNSAAAMRFGLDNRFYAGPYNGKLDDIAIFSANLTVGQCKAIYNVGNSALGYSMADMNKLFTLYAAGSGTTNTSDGKTWVYLESGLSGTAGQLVVAGDKYSVVLSDTGSAGVYTYIPSKAAISIR